MVTGLIRSASRSWTLKGELSSTLFETTNLSRYSRSLRMFPPPSLVLLLFSSSPLLSFLALVSLLSNWQCELSESGEYVWSYKAMLELSNRQNLLEVILNTPCGMKEPSENDAYNGVEVMERRRRRKEEEGEPVTARQGDVKSLKESNEIYAIQNAESRSTLLFPRHKHLEIQVGPEL